MSKRIVIVGVGFGGLSAARQLGGKGFDVLLIDRRNYHLFQPLLYQVATASLEQESIAHTIRAIVRGWRGIHFRLGEVSGVDLGRRQVLIGVEAIDYDYLILAPGSVTNFFGLESIRKYSYDLKQLGDAVTLRNQVLRVCERASHEPAPEARRALLTFVVVGGGPTGVEFSGALAELIRHVLSKDYPELRPSEIHVLLLEAADRLLLTFPENLSRYALKRLEQLGVEVKLKAMVSGAEDDQVILKDGTTIATRTLFWAAGVKAAPLAEALAGPHERGGRIPVQPDLSLESHPEVFVIGDAAYLKQDNQPLPMLAPVAMQQGSYAARVIVKRERSAASPSEPFRYRDKGIMSVIGRGSAVAVTFGIKLTGFLAWLVWLGLHLFYLIGFRNRIFVMINWAYDYLLFERQVRLITENRKGY